MAARLQKSCDAWGIPYDIECVPDQGSWEENCCYKAEFILKKLLEHKKPVLWVDADAEIVQQLPETFDGTFGTIINHDLDETHASKVISGVVYAEYCEEAVLIIKKWIAICKVFDSKEWDQIALREALKDEKPLALPLSYYAVYDRVEEGDSPVIIHYQASRLLKKVCNNEIIDLFS